MRTIVAELFAGSSDMTPDREGREMFRNVNGRRAGPGRVTRKKRLETDHRGDVSVGTFLFQSGAKLPISVT
jgi:hypothetical protein